jgi:hypothetical protein
MIDVPDLPDGRRAIEMDQSHLSGRKPDMPEPPLTGHELGGYAGTPHQLTTFAPLQFYVVDIGPQWNLAKGKSVP